MKQIRYRDLSKPVRVGISIAWFYGLVVLTFLILGIIDGVLK
jgi:hypothetical protein